MNIFITGGTGFIGSQWVQHRLSLGDQVTCLTRNVEKAGKVFSAKVRLVASLEDVEASEFDLVVNLAGEPIADRRWSVKQKEIIYNSRVSLTSDLVGWMLKAEQPPADFISGSAIGFYGSDMDAQQVDEDSAGLDGFTHQLCADWEQAALEAEKSSIRVVLLRTGVVLDPQGGALAKMLPAFKFFLGGPVASGKQWFSWIAMSDYLKALDFLVAHKEINGAVNLTSPEAVTNEVFSKALATQLSRPCLFRVPSFVIEGLLGEGAELLLKGKAVYPKKLLHHGFQFDYPSVDSALKQMLISD